MPSTPAQHLRLKAAGSPKLQRQGRDARLHQRILHGSAADAQPMLAAMASTAADTTNRADSSGHMKRRYLS